MPSFQMFHEGTYYWWSWERYKEFIPSVQVFCEIKLLKKFQYGGGVGEAEEYENFKWIYGWGRQNPRELVQTSKLMRFDFRAQFRTRQNPCELVQAHKFWFYGLIIGRRQNPHPKPINFNFIAQFTRTHGPCQNHVKMKPINFNFIAHAETV